MEQLKDLFKIVLLFQDKFFCIINDSMSTNTSNEGEIRKGIIEANGGDGLVDCIITLPGQLFYTTQIPVCLWFLVKNKRGRRYRKRNGEILFIDARKMGYMEDRTHRVLSEEDIQKIACLAWGRRNRGI